MHKRLLSILVFGLFSLAAVSYLLNPLAYNLIMLLSGATKPGLAESGSIWYGLGLRELAEEDSNNLIYRSLSGPPPQIKCTEQELRTLRIYSNLPFQLSSQELRKRQDIVLRARQAVCEGQLAEALLQLQKSDDSEFVIQQLAAMRELGRGEDAVPLLVSQICPSDTEWCEWCVKQMAADNADKDIDGDSNAYHDVWQYTNDSEGRYRGVDRVDLGTLDQVWAPNVTLIRRVPLIIGDTGSSTKGDNYIEYSTLPVSGSVVRYRLSGVTIGDDMESCIYPRLVFWGERGKYIGEAAPRYVISGKFDIELWWPLTQEITEVTPRISFDSSCFDEGQKIAICSADLAVSQ